MARYFTELAFDGTDYHGWQYQPNATTVQEVLEEAFSRIIGIKISLTGAGRTDTGVHASYYIAHFDIDNEDFEANDQLIFRLNRYLPPDIVIRKIYQVKAEMHARFSATYRTYCYYISRKKTVFERKYRHFYYGKLDTERILKACDILKKQRDFTSFAKLHTDVKTHLCEIRNMQWTETEDEYIFEITADRFLRNMVRSIVGTLLEIGRGNLTITDLKKIIGAKNRSEAGDSVPAKGLFLTDIGY